MQKGELIGRGMTAEVYKWGNDRVLKLFYSGFNPDWIKYEARIGMAVYEAGASAPSVYGIVDDDGRMGIEYEHIDGTSMIRHIEKKPWKAMHFACKMAQLHASMHSTHCGQLPLQKERLKNAIKSAGAISEESKDLIIQYLNRLPGGSSVCHGDFHPDNILISQKGMTAIDWTNAFSGNPLGDVARTCIMFRSPFIPPDTSHIAASFLRVFKNLMYSAYIKEYIKLARVDYADIDAWILPVAAARLCDKIPGEEKWLLDMISDRLKTVDAKTQIR
jgi:uncharacterized protein (TIGR02172 family)